MTAIDFAMPAAPTTLSLEWLTETLNGLHPPRDDFEAQEILGWFRTIVEPRLVRGLLDDICVDEVVLRHIAGRSYRHVNHFDKILLVDSRQPGGYRLTLHLWEPPYSAAEIDDELIHDHRFSFWSCVLTGELVSQNFQIVEPNNDDEYRTYQYSPEMDQSTTTANTYKFMGQAGLRPLPSSVESAGGVYYLRFDRVHRVVLPRLSSTCTLVLRGPRERSFSNVFNTAYPSTDTTIANVMFSPHELRAKLDRIRSRLSKP